MRSERYQNLVAALGEAIYHQSWLGQYWGRAGAIALARERCFCLMAELGKTGRDVLSGLSSTYYSAAGHAWARAKNAKKSSVVSGSLAFLFWAWRAWRCLRQAVLWSDQLEKAAGGLKNLTADELDVRCSILRKAKRWEKARAAAGLGLQKDDLSMNTRCLLLLGRAEATEMLAKDEEARVAYLQVRDLIDQLLPETQVRAWRALAGRFERMGHTDKAREARAKARALATAEGLDDQVIKLG